MTSIFWYADVPWVTKKISSTEHLKKAGVYIICLECIALFVILGYFAWKKYTQHIHSRRSTGRCDSGTPLDGKRVVDKIKQRSEKNVCLSFTAGSQMTISSAPVPSSARSSMFSSSSGLGHSSSEDTRFWLSVCYVLKGNSNKNVYCKCYLIALQNLFGSRDILIEVMVISCCPPSWMFTETSRQRSSNVFIFKSTCFNGKK